MILTLFVSGLTGSIPVIKAQEWRLMSREEIEAKVHPVFVGASRGVFFILIRAACR